MPSVEIGLVSRRADTPADAAKALADFIRTTTAEKS
jgi:hypothetical protein